MQQSATDNVARGNLGDVLFRGTDATSQHLGAIHAAINRNHEETVSRFASLDEKISILKATVENRFDSLTEKVDHFGTRPFRSVKKELTDEDEFNNPPTNGKEAILSKSPKNLYLLWTEYVVGLGGRKAARHFTRKERGGKTKYLFYKRNLVWKKIKDCLRLN